MSPPGVETQFTNSLDPEPRSRAVFSFHRLETLLKFAQETEQLRGRLGKIPQLDPKGLWPPQISAIRNLARSLARPARDFISSTIRRRERAAGIKARRDEPPTPSTHT